MIHSRAFLLLRKELTVFWQEEQQEISVSPNENGNDFFHWNVTIRPKDCIWEGGVFKALVHFNGDYNYVAPKIQFLTIPFHPNVDGRTGEVFLNITQTWCEENNTPQLLRSLLDIFDTPELKSAAILNKDAAKMLRLTPHTYRQMALDCVAASVRVQSGRTPHGKDTSKESVSLPVSYKPNEEQKHRAKPISFVDYQAFWKSIATSITDEDGSTVLQTGINSLRTDEDLLEQTLRFQDMIHRYQSVKYGILQSRNPPMKSKDSKPPQQMRAEHMDHLRALYHHGTVPELTESSTENNNDNLDVQDLLDWTKQLDANQIDST